MRRVERIELRYQHGNSNKFWIAFIRGPDAIAWWGRIGTRGSSQHISAWEARDRIHEKITKGYSRVSDQAIDYDGDWNPREVEQVFAQMRRTAQTQVKDRKAPAIFRW